MVVKSTSGKRLERVDVLHDGFAGTIHSSTTMLRKPLTWCLSILVWGGKRRHIQVDTLVEESKLYFGVVFDQNIVSTQHSPQWRGVSEVIARHGTQRRSSRSSSE